MNNLNNPLHVILLIEDQIRDALSILKSCNEELIRCWSSGEEKHIIEAFQKIMNQLHSQIKLCEHLYTDILAHQNLTYR